MIKVGITGGIGSGKTTVCRMFEELGVPVYYADDRAKYLMQHEHFLIDSIKKHFGVEVYANGRLNRALLAGKVFNQPEKLKLLNSLVHPAVFKDTEEWLQKLPKSTPYCLKEAALLVETGSYKNLDALIVVTAPEQMRMERVVQRDGVQPADVSARMQHQLPEAEKIKRADYIIENNGTLTDLQNRVQAIHTALLAKSAA